MLLQALNLHKQYDDLPVLRGVNVDIHEGEFVAIIGQSGSGKTTLLHSLSGLTPIDRGDIFIGEHRITSKDAFSRRKRRRDAQRVAIAKLRRDHVGFIFQDLNLIESLNVEDNLRLPANSPEFPSLIRRLTTPSTTSASQEKHMPTPTSSPVGNGSAWLLRVRWCANPSCCSRTNPPDRLMCTLVRRSWTCCGQPSRRAPPW